MLNGAYASLALGKNCSALCVYDIFCYCVDNWLSFKVNSLNLVASILWRRIECDCKAQACVQTFSVE